MKIKTININIFYVRDPTKKQNKKISKTKLRIYSLDGVFACRHKHLASIISRTFVVNRDERIFFCGFHDRSTSALSGPSAPRPKRWFTASIASINIASCSDGVSNMVFCVPAGAKVVQHDACPCIAKPSQKNTGQKFTKLWSIPSTRASRLMARLWRKLKPSLPSAKPTMTQFKRHDRVCGGLTFMGVQGVAFFLNKGGKEGSPFE